MGTVKKHKPEQMVNTLRHRSGDCEQKYGTGGKPGSWNHRANLLPLHNTSFLTAYKLPSGHALPSRLPLESDECRLNRRRYSHLNKCSCRPMLVCKGKAAFTPPFLWLNTRGD